MSGILFNSGEVILFQGDSITDAGRRDATSADGLGSGYVAIIRGLMAERHPSLNLRFLNRGVSGDRSEELLKRWDADCLELKPAWLSIMVGVNDVWRKRVQSNGQRHIPLPEFQANYVKLIEQAKTAKISRLVLVSPTTIDDDPESDLNQLLTSYDDVVRELAQQYAAIYVPARERLLAAIHSVPDVKWTTDGCHPTVAGHAVIADAWLEAVGAV